jgi:hypothetical protein
MVALEQFRHIRDLLHALASHSRTPGLRELALSRYIRESRSRLSERISGRKWPSLDEQYV